MKNIFYLFLILILSAPVIKAQEGQTNYVSKSFSGVNALEAKLYSKSINIKTWNKNEVSIIAIIPSERMTRKVEHDEWLTLSGIEISMNNGQVFITDKNFLDVDNADFKAMGLEIIPSKKYVTKEKNGYFYFDGKNMVPLDQAIKTNKPEGLNKKYLTPSFMVMVPTNVALHIENEFGMLSIDSDVTKATIKGHHLTAIASSVQNLNLKTAYSSLSFINIGNATIDVKESRLFADSIQSADFISSESIIDISNVQRLKMNSVTDEYIVRSADVIEGTKRNGRLTINVLNESIDVEAENANMSFNRVGAGLKKVNIQNKYANIRFGIARLENYVVSVQGGNTFAVMPLNSSNYIINNRGAQTSTDRKDFVVGTRTEKTPVFNIKGDYCSISFQ